MSRTQALRDAESLAEHLLDTDILADEVVDLIQSDPEFVQLAVAREAVLDATRTTNGERTRRLDAVWDELDAMAADRLRDLMDDRGLEAGEVTA